MRALLVATLLTALVAPAAAADTKPATPSSPGFASDAHFPEHGGPAIYAHVCAGCHMEDARGASGAGAYPALAGDTRLAVTGYPITIVLHGHKAMPPLGEYLSDRQVADVVNYVRTHFGNHYGDAATPAEVKAAR
jgi:mono/diheme cytochrome c family protein